ncbi:MAG TPA: UDP-N-acetylmuramoyl-L-alanyl-D-glutamate--2,6-diaminopimelate ligase [Acidimicrobiales bacterium]|nr:UDP-N-acetylmuramoyl-L-alanyl-D-glutamate--2,6-diaminopimelate ligase [Acidimicrobiales bacterium]
MQLGDILDDVSLDVVTSSLEIDRVEIDSRVCGPGALFFAMPGTKQHGVAYAREAVALGAECVVGDVAVSLDAPVIVVPASQLPALLSHASATVTGHPETKTTLVGVTGTNGKTSVTTILASLARALAWNASSIGTLTNERTTPAPPELYRALASAVAGFDPANPHSLVALEVSSHALDQHRVDGLRFCVAAFTNLSHDHLDYHDTMENYFAAKASLFTSEYAKRSVIWTDDAYGARLAEMTSLPVVSVGRADARDVVNSLRGSTFFWRGHLVNSPLVGDYNVDNALMAMSIMSALGEDDGAVAAAMSDVESVPGRFDMIYGRGVTVVIDYAHTPDGLERLLRDVRALQPEGRLITVFGAGGDRDREKRPEMGRIATAGSDLTIVTSDNPRSEEPDAIIDAVVSGIVAGARVIRLSDRRTAIAQALGVAQAGDVVVIAGKGHEATQTVGDLVLAFDDRAVARELLGVSGSC